uniref:(northern house mosquito) hypothetical protein n=1 Tax=Culex pipiens TaxID=7175 RepID=A0A8D8G6N7_CULPI
MSRICLLWHFPDKSIISRDSSFAVRARNAISMRTRESSLLRLPESSCGAHSAELPLAGPFDGLELKIIEPPYSANRETVSANAKASKLSKSFLLLPVDRCVYATHHYQQTQNDSPAFV